MDDLRENLDEKANLIEANRKTGVKNTREIDELKKKAANGGLAGADVGDKNSGDSGTLSKLDGLTKDLTPENLPNAMNNIVNFIKKLDVHVTQDNQELKN